MPMILSRGVTWESPIRHWWRHAHDVALSGDDVTHRVAVLPRRGHRLDDLAEKLVADDPLGLLLFIERAEDHVAEGLPPPDATIRTAEASVLDLDDDKGTVGVRRIAECRTRDPLLDQTSRTRPVFPGLIEGQRPHRVGHAAPCAPPPGAALHIVLVIRHDCAVMVPPVVGGVRHCSTRSDDRVALALEPDAEGDLVEAEDLVRSSQLPMSLTTVVVSTKTLTVSEGDTVTFNR